MGNTIVTLVLQGKVYTFIIPYIIMFAKKFLLLIAFLFFLCNLASADIFTVTSNADAGTGTLREALTLAAANGSAVKDYIYFNLPDLSKNGRTITLITDLPGLSSNLVVDGTTQPGQKFGVSDAKVQIMAIPNSNATMLSCFSITKERGVEIYGFMFNVPDAYANTNLGLQSGIWAIMAKDIIIGAPGKGNIFKNISVGIYIYLNYSETIETISENVKISSNILGIEEDGETLTLLGASGIYATRVKNLTIGGNSTAERNVCVGNIVYDELTYVDLNINTGKILVANNFIGLNYTGTKTLYTPQFGNGLFVSGYYLQDVEITKNVLAGRTGFDISLVPCFFKVRGNKFGTDVTGTQVLGSLQFQARISYCNGGGIFGGSNPEDQNIFSGAYQDNTNPSQTNSGIILNVGSPNVEVVNNIFRCNYSFIPYRVEGFQFNQFAILDKRTANSVSGTANPGSRIDLYYSLTCSNCEPEQLFATTTADANGKWNYTGTLQNHNIIASSTLNGSTSEFTTLSFINADSDVKIKMACNNQGGEIKGLKTNKDVTYTWYNEAGSVINTQDLLNVPSGKYYLVISDGYCSITSPIYEIKDASNQINASAITITPASCNNNDGSITGIQTDPEMIIEWTKPDGTIAGSTIDLYGVQAGKYTLTVYTQDRSCSQVYGPVTIINTNGPLINTTAQQIQKATCNNSDGSITGITITGTGTIEWINEQGVSFGNSINLTGVPAGKYKLTVTGTGCPPVSTGLIEILSIDGITIDDIGKVISKATCQYDNGGISNIKVTGATKYNWYNTGNNLVSSELNLTGMPTGDYYLIAANDNGCSKQTAVYTITREAPVSYSGVTKKLNDATCDENNGSIELIFEHAPAQLPESYKWVNPATGQAVITSTPIVTGIDAGKYDIYAITNGCEQYIISYSIYRIPGLTVVTNNVHVNDDHCSAGTGSIKGILAAGKTPLDFIWTDDNGINKGALPNLLNVPAGTYHLKVTDGSNCEQGFVYTVYDQSDAIPSPNVSDVQLCSPGDVLLSVSNTDSRYSYRLYEDNNNAAPIDEQQSGRFKVNVKDNRSYYISQYFGNCESLRQEVKVLISGLSGTDITNTFTPNGDGINDYWKIKGIENYTNGTIKVFNREGKTVFQSKGYATPFDGTLNSKPLPVGVYYYIIDLKTCDLLSGSLTILR
ncbi:MAG: hypothetical protein JWQ85_1625 [Mucilaginibacter sp.]|nr:hypothetical protein [Mucilaginibacter sp.]